MDMKDLSWQAFRATGDIDAYLLYTETDKMEKQRDNLCSALKQGESLQDGQTTEKQM